jgi:hypothetical protein
MTPIPHMTSGLSGIARYVPEGARFNIHTEKDALKNQNLPDLKIAARFARGRQG